MKYVDNLIFFIKVTIKIFFLNNTIHSVIRAVLREQYLKMKISVDLFVLKKAVPEDVKTAQTLVWLDIVIVLFSSSITLVKSLLSLMKFEFLLDMNLGL